MGRTNWTPVKLMTLVVIFGLVYLVRSQDIDEEGDFDDDITFAELKPINNNRIIRKTRQISHFPPMVVGCSIEPKKALHAITKCRQTTCWITCEKLHKFPDSSVKQITKCENDQWINTKTKAPWNDVIMECQPTCDPPCGEDEVCISPNNCEASVGPFFHGPLVRNSLLSTCTGSPTIPINSNVTCTTTECKVSCLHKYKPKNGVEQTSVMCKDGDWETAPLKSVECQPICDQVCLNEGVCFSPNVCKCKDAFKGPLCQYSTSRCSSTTFDKFSVQSNCTGNDEKVTCTLSCDKGYVFTHNVSSTYVCYYSTAEFMPKNIPRCISAKNNLPTTTTNKPVITSEDQIYNENRPFATKGICSTWNGDKIKTFDGLIYANHLRCSHTMVQNTQGSFRIVLRSSPPNSKFLLPHALEVFLDNEQYTLENVDGQVKVSNTKMEIQIPIHYSGIEIKRSGNDIKVNFDNRPFTIVWDTELYVQVEINAGVFMETSGICGTFDGNLTNDLIDNQGISHKLPSAFVNTMKVSSLDKDPACKMIAALDNPTVCETNIESKANEICNELWKNEFLKFCLNTYNKDVVIKNCKQDYCGCTNIENKAQCACRGVAALTKDCVFHEVATRIEWRDSKICPMVCTNGKVYKSNGPMHEPVCGSATVASTETREGCFCPDDQILDDGVCISPKDCPCQSDGKVFPSGTQIARNCNRCLCKRGFWECTKNICDARCSSYGDPHYQTFDGRKYGFMGKCSYYLMKTDKLTVEAENVACDYNENLESGGSFSCTKSVTIKFIHGAYRRSIKLMQDRKFFVDGVEVRVFPRTLNNGLVTITEPSSSFVLVNFNFGLKVWFDGEARCNIDADASFRGKTAGLCGNYNSNVKDDFLTPDGAIETSVEQFANKWKTDESCPDQKEITHPCIKKPENKAKAEKICQKIKENSFKDCHGKVNPETFYQNCLFDVCACKSDIESECACPIMTAYSAECSREGINLGWQNDIVECAVQCPIGQEFKQCGDACFRTCSDVSREANCSLQCVEGCRCPDGLYLDDNSNECVLVSECNCIYKRQSYAPGHLLLREILNVKESCTCSNAKWNCVTTPNVTVNDLCDGTKNEEYTKCEPIERKTCKNQHHKELTSQADCEEGCVCKNGFVFDTNQKKCVLAKDCSCQHNGKTFLEGELTRMDCNTCSCKNGEWSCSKQICNPTCSIWGDGHFTTFDGFNFDFLGACEYVLSKGKLDNGDGFSVTIQNVFCGSKGVTCSKSLKIHTEGSSKESLFLTDNSRANRKENSKLLIHVAGVFTVIEIPHLEVQIKWDRFTRMYIKLGNRWKERVQGLCGNYNDNILDEMKTPSFGIETNPLAFGNSWKLDPSCQMPRPLSNACGDNQQRRAWSQQQCAVLKSSVFSKCHAQVPVDIFHSRCLFDACACDQGGDCKCLCTALAAYGHACTMAGVTVNWRTPDLCPMQCDPKCSSYSSCISACPVKTCDNLMLPTNQLMCSTDLCVEGCEIKKCENPNFIYANDLFTHCQSKSECETPCMFENGISYKENQLMPSDECFTCTCSMGSKVCNGLPCNKEEVPVEKCKEPNNHCDTNCTSIPNYKKNKCAYPCGSNNACHYYNEKMISEENCAINSEECVPGCVPENTQTTCLSPKVWRDQKTCVDVSQCTCMDKQGNQVAPTKVVVESACETCQCLNNEYNCVNNCVEPTLPPPLPNANDNCNPDILIKEHPLSCAKFQECELLPNSTRIYTDQECDSGDLFNSKTLQCEAKETVYKIKPGCLSKEGLNNPKEALPEKDETFILRNPPTPPAECKTRVIPTIEKLKPTFAASSHLSSDYRPSFANPHAKGIDGSKVAWIALQNDLNQVIEIRYPKTDNFYGIVVQGHPMYKQYVTSFKMLFSTDGINYYYMQNINSEPKIFGGSYDNGNPVKIDFDYPVEAKFLRIIPLTWFGAISMRVEILGCSLDDQECKTAKTCDPTIPVKAPLCRDPMGVENGKMNTSQITFSSNNIIYGTSKNEILQLKSSIGWKPFISRNNEYVMFDFLEPRNVTGIITKGGSEGWVKVYQVLWGDDIKNLKFMEKNHKKIAFLANVNKFSEKINFFDFPIRARYLKVVPKNWLNKIQMKVEPLGCFKDYPSTVTPEPKPNVCSSSTCPGIEISETKINCPCKSPQFWNGDKCVLGHECPCVKEGDLHNVGNNYRNENCETCTCALNGVENCVPKECPDCGEGNYRAAPGTCSCDCIQCPSNSKSCPSSQECIPKEKWCDGIKDCAEDEVDCPSKKPIVRECKKNECPEGSIAVTVDKSNIDLGSKIIKTTSFEAKDSKLATPSKNDTQDECPMYTCDGTMDCVICPEGMVKIKLSKEGACPACIYPPTKNATCRIDGKSITTFDNTEFKHDLCDHVLARDVADKKWNVIIKKNCPNGRTPCSKQVIIIDKLAKYKLTLLQDMTVTLNGIKYTMDQLGTQDDFIVKLSKVGDTLLFNTMLRGVWVELTNQGNIKIFTSDQNLNQIDGICGFYNEDLDDDKRKPDGSISTSLNEFSDSWSLDENDLSNCVPFTCPKNLEEKAIKICNLAKSDAFKTCGKVMDLEKFMSQCFESACECLSTDSIAAETPEEIEDECKCIALGMLATECMSAGPKIQLESWRAIHECEVESCVAPFVHNDCYRHECEATCDNIAGCPATEGSCYSGCFCPDGQVKKGDSCVMASKCRNCVCDGFGQSQYLTYDRSNFTFDGNCTYLLSRDVSAEKVHSFQAYATVGPCKTIGDSNEESATCTKAIYLLHGSKKIHVRPIKASTLGVYIDDIKIKLPYNQNGIEINEETTELKIFLTKTQIELNIVFKNMAFSIKVPKLKYGDKMEGLCGNCNGNMDDDLQENPKKLTEIMDPNENLTQKQSVDNFVWSWLSDEPKLKLLEKSCYVDRKEPCLQLPPERDPCLKILENPVFEPCHLVVSPFSYIDSCQKYICRAGLVSENVCEPISAYVRECARKNICINWRTNNFCKMDCEAPFEYSACRCSETCESFEAKLKLIASSTSAIKKDSNALAKLTSTCKSNTNEGCFCPPGKIQRDNKCILEKECKKCDETHFLGDIWFTDSCTKCECLSSGMSSCSKENCPLVVCEIGFKKVEIPSESDGCCSKKFECVPEPCANSTALPECAENQFNKKFKQNGTECYTNICECIPKSKCPAIKDIALLEVGMKAEVDPTRCCDFLKAICDKSKCPVKPLKCSEDFYEVVITRSIDVTKCCNIYECKPPPKHCIAKINGKSYKYNPGDTWTTDDACVKSVCNFNQAGIPTIEKQTQTCEEICNPGEAVKKSPSECCGKCVRVQCNMDNKLYNVGQSWQMPGDNCTTFKCETINKEVSVSSSSDTCPDISKCPPKDLYQDGCCQRCKLPVLPQMNCVSTSMALNLTVGLVYEQIPVRGICKNKIEIKGFTECSGTCNAATKYNPRTFGQSNNCGCCTATRTTDIYVDLECQDGSSLKKQITVPLECACTPGGCSESHRSFSPRIEASQ